MRFLTVAFLMFSMLFSVFFLGGCSREKPFVVFSSTPILESTTPEYKFQTGQKIYYAVVHPKGFKEDHIKVQIFKKDEKSEYWGYSHIYNRTCELTHKKFYRDYIVIHTPGLYVMQVFYISDLGRPITMQDFWVVER